MLAGLSGHPDVACIDDDRTISIKIPASLCALLSRVSFASESSTPPGHVARSDMMLPCSVSVSTEGCDRTNQVAPVRTSDIIDLTQDDTYDNNLSQEAVELIDLTADSD